MVEVGLVVSLAEQLGTPEGNQWLAEGLDQVESLWVYTNGVTPALDSPYQHRKEFQVAPCLNDMRQKFLKGPEASLPSETPLQVALPNL